MIHGFVDMHVGYKIFPNSNKKNNCQEGCGPPPKKKSIFQPTPVISQWFRFYEYRGYIQGGCKEFTEFIDPSSRGWEKTPKV